MTLSYLQIFEELKQKGIVDTRNTEIAPLSELGNSRVFGISKDGVYQYVVKVNRPSHVKAEVTFLKEYQKNPLTPQLLYVDPDFKYLVYQYIVGKRADGEIRKSVWINELVENYINQYIPYPDTDWGYLDDSRSTYSDILKSDINYWNNAMQVLSEEDHQMVLNYATEIGNKFDQEKYLVHGDPSIRNLLFKDEKLAAVIDPYPFVGPKLYDVLYAFCSNTQDFEIDCLRGALNTLKNERKSEEIIIKHLLINLYCRFGIIIKHNTGDLEGYKKAWNYWKQLLHNM